jgi:hypothetical protein
MSKTPIERELQLLHRLLSTHNKAVIDRFLPAVERVEANLKSMRRTQNDRLDQLESAVADIAAELTAVKSRALPGDGIDPGFDVRPG